MLVKFFCFFVLAHLLGDFVLQTDKIASKKAYVVKILNIHILVIFIVQMLIMSLFGLNGIIAAFISSVLHYLLDFIKPKYSKQISKNTVSFLLDQCLHILIIIGLSFIFRNDINYQNNNTYDIVKYLISIILSTYVLTILLKLVLADIIKKIILIPFFIKGERLIDGCYSLITLFLIEYINSIFRMVVLIVISILYSIIQVKKFKYIFMPVSIKIMTIIAINLIISIFILP